MKRSTLILILSLCSTLVFGQKTNEHFHDFDFWLGEWNVYKFGTDTLVGKSQIQSIIDSVGIMENYKSTQSLYQGKSLNKYDPQLKKWDQFWVDNGGLTLRIQGGLVDGSMVMGNETNEITWTPLEGDRVRQTWKIRKAKDAAWKKAFDGEYKRAESKK